jgi:hypothetical protein
MWVSILSSKIEETESEEEAARKKNPAGRYLETSQVFTNLPLKLRKRTNTAL